ncbi:MAG: flagellar basal body-associated FliL family protein [Fibromonadaceae bacterium]|jgi:flagellar FliL protein|nr:flagellar basal body-associated FliL family protein [Fibromonadaceae bacterium]
MPREEEKPAEAPAPDDGGAKKALVKWAIVAFILLLFIGIEVGIASFFVKKLKETADSADSQKVQDAAEQEAKLREQTEMGATLATPIEVLVNISGEDGRYLKCGIQLEYDISDAQLGVELEMRKARMKDIILDIMSSRPMPDLMTNDGKKSIREQIVAEINTILPDAGSDGKKLGKIKRSYFDSFMIQ